MLLFCYSDYIKDWKWVSLNQATVQTLARTVLYCIDLCQHNDVSLTSTCRVNTSGKLQASLPPPGCSNHEFIEDPYFFVFANWLRTEKCRISRFYKRDFVNSRITITMYRNSWISELIFHFHEFANENLSIPALTHATAKGRGLPKKENWPATWSRETQKAENTTCPDG